MNSKDDVQGEVGDEEFESLTNDAAKARMLRKMVQNLAEGEKSDPLAEMARDVMAGRKGIRQAIDELPRQESLERSFDEYHEYWGSMSEKERFEAEKQARQFLNEQREELIAERNVAQRKQTGTERHSSRGWSLY